VKEIEGMRVRFNRRFAGSGGTIQPISEVTDGNIEKLK
jgi:hypothetical protein